MLPRPVDLTAVNYSTARLSHILWTGVPGSAMPRWNRLTATDLRAIVSYVHSIGPEKRREANADSIVTQGREVYRENCTGCHGAAGSGDGPAGGAIAPGPTNFHEERPSKARALQVLKDGIPGTAMPSWEVQLSDVQREAVVAYLESLYQASIR